EATLILTLAGTNAQGVAQISNGVSVFNLGQSSVANPSPAPAASLVTAINPLRMG
ncbi:hypothetical protein Tco_0869455, partial [Tanacetum coccineum]